LAASIHGKGYTAEQGAKLVVPFLNIASSQEPEQPEFEAAVRASLKDKYKFIRYDDVPHGFAASRGQWATNETHRERAEQAIQEFVNFVKKHLVEV
jgi:dienelactone hydrolase